MKPEWRVDNDFLKVVLTESTVTLFTVKLTYRHAFSIILASLLKDGSFSKLCNLYFHPQYVDDLLMTSLKMFPHSETLAD